MMGIACRAAYSGPFTFTSQSRSISPGALSGSSLGSVTPALQNRMSMRPNRLTHSSIIRSLSSRRLTSVRTKRPACIVASSGCSTSARMRRAPSAAKRRALARPMPLAAPVITAARPASRPSGIRTQALPRGPESLDAELHDVAGGEEAGRLLPEPHTGRRSGRDHVTGKQSHELADVADERGHVEHQLLGRAGLLRLAIDLEPHGEVVHIRDFVRRGEKGPQRRERVAAIALHPLAAALELEGPLRVVVVQHVAGDVPQGGILFHVARAPADHDRQLDLPIGLAAALGDDDVIVRPGHSGRGLEKEDGLGGEGLSRFLGMVAVVQADAHDLARPAERGAESDVVSYGGRRATFLGEPARQPLDAIRLEECLVVVCAELRNVDSAAVREYHAGPLLSRCTEANEFHALTS